MSRFNHTVRSQADNERRSVANTPSLGAISLPAVKVPEQKDKVTAGNVSYNSSKPFQAVFQTKHLSSASPNVNQTPVSFFQIYPASENQQQNKRGCTQCYLKGDNTLQRMVAVAANDIGQTKDALILNNLNYAQSHFGGVVGDFKANRKFDQTKPGERVGLVAHGAPGNIGGFKAPAIADILTAKDHPVNKEVSSIVLYSCNAGMDQTSGVDTSLVHELSAELLKRDYEIGVEGLKGIGFGFKGIGERTTKGDEETGDTNWFFTRDKLFKKSEYKGWGVKGKGFVEADELLKVAGKLESGKISKMTLEEKAMKISEIMAPFWREVEKEMGDQLYDHLKGWVRVKSYVTGGKLVQDSR